MPHESLWCRCNKLEVFNRAEYMDVRDYLRRPGAVRERAWERGAEAGDCRVTGVLDQRRLLDLSAEEGTRTLGVLADYMPTLEHSRSARDIWSWTNLRYCPICLDAGVHVTYFQFAFVSRCPVHRVRLETRCPKCRRQIPYSLGAYRSARRFGCVCGRKLWGWEKAPENRVTSPMKAGHARAGEWVTEVMNFGPTLHHPWHCVSWDGPIRLRQFSSFIALVRPSLGHLRSNYDSRVEQSVRCTRINPVPTSHGQSEMSRLVATYKSICRHLYRRYLRRHRRAIRVMAKLICRGLVGDYGELEWARPFGLAASAFVAWRMYWEGLKSPSDVFKPRDYRRCVGLCGDWKDVLIERFKNLASCPRLCAPRSLITEIRVRWFARACLGVFQECLGDILGVFADKPKEKGHRWTYSTSAIRGYDIPLMLPIIERDGMATLHWLSEFSSKSELPAVAENISRPPTASDCADFQKAQWRIFSQIYRAIRLIDPSPAKPLIQRIMITDKIKELETARVKLAELEKAVERKLPQELAELPVKYGFASVEEFASAVRAAVPPAAKRYGRLPATATKTVGGSVPRNRRKRASITDETRELVKKLVGEGKTGAQIAVAAGISRPSVQKVKAESGLVRVRKPRE